MTSIDRLAKHFEKFPGIGPRQARRFVYHLLSESKDSLRELGDAIENLKAQVAPCAKCFRFFAKNGNGHSDRCEICGNAERNHEQLMVVESDADITAIERSGIYDGLYFVLGGTVPLLESEDTKKLRGGALKAIAEERAKDGLKEVILAFAVNPDGENTARYVESLLKDLVAEYNLKVSMLGRGLSTGSELEYADPETIKNALQNRH